MIHFKCDRCTNCCNWPGEVVVTDVEIDLMAKQLDISPQIFIEKYTDLRENRNGLTLKTNKTVHVFYSRIEIVQSILINPINVEISQIIGDSRVGGKFVKLFPQKLNKIHQI